MKNSQISGIKLQIILPMVITLICSLATTYYFLIHNNEKNIINSSILYAKSNIAQYLTLREYYTREVIDVAQQHSNLEVDIFAQNKPNTIPLPATMIHELSDILKNKDSHIKLNIYSKYPFPNRNNKKLDTFEKESLDFLEKNPSETFVKRQIYNNKDSVRVVVADVFSSNTCVSCHNALPNSPKRDWKLNDVGGALEIIVPIDKVIATNNKNTVQISIIIFIILTVLIVAIYFYIDLKIIKSIEKISDFVQNVKDGDLEDELVLEQNNELKSLSTNINAMKISLKDSLTMFYNENQVRRKAQENVTALNTQLEQKVKIRTKELNLRNNELIKTLRELKATKDDLLESQRMAAIGELVGAVTHEINTPLGISVTTSSFIESITKDLKKLYKSDDMSEDDFENYLESVQNNIKIILDSLERVSKMLRSFKHIAIDQTIEDKREFYLKEYIDEILLSLRNKTKKYKHKIIIDIDESIKIDSYPGYFYQIITNFINNSYLHGFEGIKEGTVNISANIHDDELEFIYEDNGNGAKKEVLDHVFEEYYTTRKGEGGTGLGLSIVHNLVVNKLNGTIDISSEENKGFKYVILIPKGIINNK